MKHWIVVLLLFLSFTANSQNWASLNGGANNQVLNLFGDTVNHVLYATGFFTSIGNITTNNIARWDGNQWDSIGHGFPNSALNTHAFTMYNGDLICANSIFSPSKIHVGKLNGTQWDSIGTNFTGEFRGVITLNNELYAYGTFDSINHVYYNSIAKWDGQNWLPVAFPYRFTGDSPYIFCLAIYNNELYAGGAFSDSTNQMVNIAKYDGTSWSVVGGGFHGPIDQVFDLEVYQDELYAAGAFKINDGNAFNYVARWNGIDWRDVGGGVTSSNNGQINDLLALNNKLRACGSFTEIGGVPAMRVATWDGINWCGFGNTANSSVGCMATINNDLYLTCGPQFDGITVNRIAKWIGGDYVDSCGNTTSINETIANKNELTVYPNPANNQITIEFAERVEDTFVEIRNTLGKTVYSEKFHTVFSKNIDITTFSNGIYFVQAQTKRGVLTQKFIKQ